MIWALTLLEQLKIYGLNFTFKGGTALLLATEKPKRFSIDFDIITEHTEKEIIVIETKKCCTYVVPVIKKLRRKSQLFLCTSSGNRTHTSLRKLDFESSASTNSAIEAYQKNSLKFLTFLFLCQISNTFSF